MVNEKFSMKRKRGCCFHIKGTERDLGTRSYALNEVLRYFTLGAIYDKRDISP